MAKDEEQIIARRFIYQTVASQANTLPPFKKLAKKYMQFSQSLESGTADEAGRVYQELLADLYAVQFHMQKLEAASEAFRREQQAYAERQAQLQAAIQQADQDIVDRKAELEQARVQLQHEKEYETIKHKIVQVPARSATRAEMAAVDKEIADLQQQGQDLDASMELRKQQFGEIVACIERVWQLLEHESEEEGALPPEAGDHQQQPQPHTGGTGQQPTAMQLG